MSTVFRAVLIGGLVVAGSAMTADSASAQWGYYGASYGGPSFSFGFSTGPRYSSYYAPSYGYTSPYGYAPTYGYAAMPSYRVNRYPAYYGSPAYYGAPRGRLSYDVYSPFGRSELNYRFRPDGRVRVDFDD
ncbi:MAG: hypothetical protein WBC44_21755 [Planctomycetaceae bacterium]